MSTWIPYDARKDLANKWKNQLFSEHVELFRGTFPRELGVHSGGLPGLDSSVFSAGYAPAIRMFTSKAFVFFPSFPLVKSKHLSQVGRM